ncbi:MAG TPA: iron-sulfur cluster biosynthesis family protein [Acidimicrobiia bacterium]|nr:iron-sulfur cluster biosynthesis family protein [Acidimicrobiia bacterium]
MLQLSENAAAALENLRESQGIPEGRETRLTAETGDAGGLALRLEFVDEVPETDETVENAGTEIHLDQTVIQPLENTIMDVRDTDEGLAFVFKSQTP